MFQNRNKNITERKIEKKIRKKERKILIMVNFKVLINQGLLKKYKLITVASMPSELRAIGNYAISNLTLQHHKNADT